MILLKKHFSPDELNNIEKLIQKINYDTDIIGLMQFGSSLKSIHHHDIDLCLFSASTTLSVEKIYEYKMFLPEKFDVHFFHRLPLYIQKEVLEKGLLLYQGDYDRLFDICYSFIKEFNLYEPRYRQYLELILDD